MMKKYLVVIFYGSLFFLLTNCGSLKNGVKYKTDNADKLLSKLKKNNRKGIMLGHQDDLAYGIGWKHNGQEKFDSDVYRATGQYPAVLGWDIGKVGSPLNIDGVSFDDMRKMIIKGHKKGIVNTISWHPFLFKDSISSWTKTAGIVKSILPNGKNHQELVGLLTRAADFIETLKTDEGVQIPILFRPWHEMDGTWFWWGKGFCTPEEYKELFRFTINFLKKKRNIKNILVTYSPDRNFYSEAEYLTYYPGDEYVDILGIDDYYDFNVNGDGLEAMANKLTIVTNLAEKRKKLAALTETGLEKIEDEFWFTQKLGKVLETRDLMSKLSYVLFWRNRDTDHFYVPYKGHKAFQDFINFAKNKKVILLKK